MVVDSPSASGATRTVRGVLGEDRQHHGEGRARRAYYFDARSLDGVAKPVLRRRRRTRLRVSGTFKRRGSVDTGVPFVRQRRVEAADPTHTDDVERAILP